MEWVLLALGVALVAAAARARTNAAPSPPTAPAPVTPPTAPVAPPSRAEVDPAGTPPGWLDNLIGTDTPADPLDDAESIAGVLRVWLDEDRT